MYRSCVSEHRGYISEGPGLSGCGRGLQDLSCHQEMRRFGPPATLILVLAIPPTHSQTYPPRPLPPPSSSPPPQPPPPYPWWMTSPPPARRTSMGAGLTSGFILAIAAISGVCGGLVTGFMTIHHLRKQNRLPQLAISSSTALSTSSTGPQVEVELGIVQATPVIEGLMPQAADTEAIVAQRLAILQGLLNRGVITPAEHDTKRAEVVRCI